MVYLGFKKCTIVQIYKNFTCLFVHTYILFFRKFHRIFYIVVLENKVVSLVSVSVRQSLKDAVCEH